MNKYKDGIHGPYLSGVGNDGAAFQFLQYLKISPQCSKAR